MKAPGINFHEMDAEYDYTIIPKLDQSHVYEAVIDRLQHGQSIGIFPEGGSHDRTEMLPIKAGVSIMALGAMARDPKCRISIVACGLKYFKPQKFRSKVIVEFSRPYRIPTELVIKYQKNKREACALMLDEVEKRMKEVTLSAPSYSELQRIYMARDIYLPSNTNDFTPEQNNEIYKRFFKGFHKYKNSPELKSILEEIEDYKKELKTFNVRDDEVKNIKINFFRIMLNFIAVIPFVLVNFVFVRSYIILHLLLVSCWSYHANAIGHVKQLFS